MAESQCWHYIEVVLYLYSFLKYYYFFFEMDTIMTVSKKLLREYNMVLKLYTSVVNQFEIGGHEIEPQHQQSNSKTK